MLRHPHFAFLAGLLALSTACGGTIADPTSSRSSDGTTTGGSGATENGSADSPGGAGSSGMPGGDGDPALLNRPVFSDQDGSFQVSQVSLGWPGSSCASDRFQDYTYDRRTHTLTKRCDVSKPLAERDGLPVLSRTLEPSEAQSIEAILATMFAIEKPRHGGWDGKELYLTVGSRKYSQWNINGYGFPVAPKIADLLDLLDKLPF